MIMSRQLRHVITLRAAEAIFQLPARIRIRQKATNATMLIIDTIYFEEERKNTHENQLQRTQSDASALISIRIN